MNGWCRFSYGTFAGAQGDARDAPIPAIRRTLIGPTGVDDCGHSRAIDGLAENYMMDRGDSRYDRLGRTVRRGSQVSPTPDSRIADPQQIIADLRRELDECRA